MNDNPVDGPADTNLEGVQDGFDLLEYPTDFLFKAMCRTEEGVDLQQTLRDLVCEKVAVEQVLKVHSNASRTGKFKSVSLLVRLHSRQELEAIYAAIAASPRVVMTL